MRKHLFVTLLLMSGLPLCGTYAAMANPVSQSQSQEAVLISGTVLDENNEPVIGASVVQQGMTKNAVATDYAGNFSIRVAVGTPLVISFVGYQAQTLPASKAMVVYLQPTTEMLDQLVVVGYGSQKRANLTGAVASVDVARTMDSRPVQDVTRALQGAVPGLTVTTSNGDFSSEATLRLRGVGTLSNNQSSAPLIVVDGVPVDDMSFLNPEDVAEISVLKDAASSAVYGTRAAFGVILVTTKEGSAKDRVSVSYTNNFAWNEATVLPTFASTTENLDAAFQTVNRGIGEIDMFGQLYVNIYPFAKAWEAQHGGKPYTDYRQLFPYQGLDNVGDYYVAPDNTWIRYAEWDVAKTLFRAAPAQKHNVSLEGTSGRTSYRLSFGYDSKEGLLKFNPEKMHRYMVNANVQTEIFSWLKAGARINFSDREFESPNNDYGRNTYQYMWRWPSFFESYGWVPDADGVPTDFSTAAIGYRKDAHVDKTVTQQTRLQAWMRAEIIKGLTLQADFTYAVRNMNSSAARIPHYVWNTWTTNAFTKTSLTTQGNSMAAQSNYKDDMWTMNVFATYDKTFNQAHNLKVMVGATAEQEEYNFFSARRTGLTDYSLPNINLTNGTTYQTSGNNWHRATAGFFGRINYNYKGIYLAEFNARYDGSSRFPAADQWAFFPSGSIGYRFSEEEYFKPLKTWWSNGKIRASYGEIGNEAVGSNMFLSTVSAIQNNAATGYSYWLNGAQKLSMYNMPSLVSSSLTWERIVTTDVGVDLGFLNNSLNVGFDWYQRDTKDMLGPAQELPSVLGDKAPYGNNGSLRTRGWELSVNWNHSFGDWDVYATATVSDAKTKITKWNDASGLIYTYDPTSGNYYEGQTYGDIWGFETDRYFEVSDFNADGTLKSDIPSQAALEAGNFHYGPGDIKFKDLDGNGRIDNGDGTKENHGDLKVIGNALPRYEYSFRVGGAWKGFDLDVFFQGVGKRNLWTTGSMVIPFAQNGANIGLFDHQLSYNYEDMAISYNPDDLTQAATWTPQGTYHVDQNAMYPVPYTSSDMAQSSTIPNIGRGGFNFYPQSRYLVNMAYLRLKNITFGYTLPYEITRKALIQKARIYFSADNLAFLYNGASKYKLDPEISQGYSGVAGQNTANAGWGRTVPMMRTYSFGIQVTF